MKKQLVYICCSASRFIAYRAILKKMFEKVKSWSEKVFQNNLDSIRLGCNVVTSAGKTDSVFCVLCAALTPPPTILVACMLYAVSLIFKLFYVINI
jgi:hypothetical protein